MKHRPIVRDGAAFVPPRELVDKVDKLLDGDAGSRRFAFAHLVPSAPARSTPTLDKGRKHSVFPPFVAYKECFRGACPRKHGS